MIDKREKVSAMDYFIEVTKMSGIKTYFGKYLEEAWEPKAGTGFEDKDRAQFYVNFVENKCREMGMALASVKVVEK